MYTYPKSIERLFQRKSFSEKIVFFVHKHPIVFPLICFLLFLLGGVLFEYIITGTFLGLFSGVVFYSILSMAIPPFSSMKRHKFHPGTFGLGTLYYHENIPILCLEEGSGYDMGYAHGVLLAPYIYKQVRRWMFFLYKAAQLILSLPPIAKPEEIFQDIQEYIPEEYMQEMKGIVVAVNEWAKKRWFFKKNITLEELVVLHLLGDALHFKPFVHVEKLPGCTAIVAEESDTGVIFARNMDWPSLGLGKYTLIIQRKKRGYSSVEIGLPGFIGVLTGITENLAVSMNVCLGTVEKASGVPAVFLNRLILESCTSFNDVTAFLQTHKPLGPYHLVVLSGKEAHAIHMQQGFSSEEHFFRKKEESEHLIITNCRYRENNGTVCQERHMFRSKERAERINALFIEGKELNKRLLALYSLQLPDVNNMETMHSVLFFPCKKELYLSFNNAFSASASFEKVPLELLLSVS